MNSCLKDKAFYPILKGCALLAPLSVQHRLDRVLNPLVVKSLKDLPDPKGRKDLLALMALQDLLDPRDRKGQLALMALQDPLVQKDPRECRVIPGRKVRQEW